MKKIYLATPYTHTSKTIMEARFLGVNKVAGELMMQGYLVFSPISHTHPIALAGKMPVEWNFWKAYDFTFINEWADEVWVLKLDGWEESVGVTAEIALAKTLGKPVIFIEP